MVWTANSSFGSSDRPLSKSWSKPWWKRITWRGALLAILGAFVILYPTYDYLQMMITGGITHRGDLLIVDLKAMSSFELNQDSGVTEDIPKIYRDLDGKRVCLTGQMYDPYGTDGKLKNFALVYSITNCCFNGPPKVQHFIQATLDPGKSADYSNNFVDVTGILHVGVQSEAGHVKSVYRIDVERVDRE